MSSLSSIRRRKKYTTEEVIEKLFLDDYEFESDEESTESSDSSSSSDTNYQIVNKKDLKKVKKRRKIAFTKKVGRKFQAVNLKTHKSTPQPATCSSKHVTSDLQYHISPQVINCDKQVQVSKSLQTTSSQLQRDETSKHDKPEHVLAETVIEIELDEEESEQLRTYQSETEDSHQTEIGQENREENELNPKFSEFVPLEDELHPNPELSILESNPSGSEIIRTSTPTPTEADEDNYHNTSEDYYTIEEISAPQNVESDENDETIIQLPLTNFERDREFPEDIDWKKCEPDTGPSYGPFLESSQLNVDLTDRSPEACFNALFDKSMFQKIADETNNYARAQVNKNLQGMDPFEFMGEEEYHPHGRRNTWQDLSASDIEIFFAHLIIMGVAKKSRIDSYWSTGTLSRTPFFGRYLSRNDFQRILWNLHCDDSSTNPLPGKYIYYNIKFEQ